MPGELVEEFPSRAHEITASEGSERKPLRRLWVTEKIGMSLRPNVAPRPTCPVAAPPSGPPAAVRFVPELKDCSMAKRSDSYSDDRVAQVCGLIVGVFIILPPLIRLAGGRWAGDDWVLVTLGILLMVTWLVFMTLGWRQRRRERDALRQIQSDETTGGLIRDGSYAATHNHEQWMSIQILSGQPRILRRAVVPSLDRN